MRPIGCFGRSVTPHSGSDAGFEAVDRGQRHARESWSPMLRRAGGAGPREPGGGAGSDSGAPCTELSAHSALMDQLAGSHVPGAQRMVQRVTNTGVVVARSWAARSAN